MSFSSNRRTSFYQSEIFQSFQKVASDKGLVPPKPIETKSKSLIKEAVAKLSVAPKTLDEKVLSLCDGLRTQGFQNYANEIETKFLLLKKAELHLYNTTGEEGKDLVEFAHQDGGTKLDKSWGELGIVETITEQQSKMLDVIRKQPKGKLANANIINAVKVVLAENNELDVLYATATTYFNQFMRGLNTIYAKVGWEPADLSYTAKALADKTILNAGDLSLETFLEPILDEADPGFFASQDEKINWQSVLRLIEVAKDIAKKFSGVVSQIKSLETTLAKQDAVKVFEDEPANAPTANTISASAMLQKLEPHFTNANEVSAHFTDLANKPSVKQDQQKSAFISKVQQSLAFFITDLSDILKKLQHMGDKLINLDDISNLVAGTKFFSQAKTYQNMVDIMIEFKSAINQRGEYVKKW